DSLTFKANDGTLDSNVATVTVTITAVNDGPVAVPDTATTAEDMPVTIAVLANDLDPEGDALGVIEVGVAAHGTATAEPDGTVTYTPAANYTGPDTFTYTIGDGHGGTASTTVTVMVTAVNDPPVAGGDGYSTNEDTPLTVAAPGELGNDTDADGDGLTAVLVSRPASGTLLLQPDGSFVYTPAANVNGGESFTYKVTDGTAESSVVTVSLTIN